MLTCKSPRKVMRVAHELACHVLPKYASRFSCQDFTLPQLFACLVLREHQKKSYRGAEALLRDAPQWGRGIGMKRVPNHNTLCRAYGLLVRRHMNMNRILDLLAHWFQCAAVLGSTLAIDSTQYDTHYRSRHYEQRCRHYACRSAATANARRSRSAKRTPKLAVGVATACHLILAAKARLGMGSDGRDFVPVLRAAHRRHPSLRHALADAGYDSDANHRLTREKFHLHSWIQATAGRPGRRLPTSRYRRLMKRHLTGSQAGRLDGQRSPVEATHSMMKRNLGEALRARRQERRRLEQFLRVITHNVMILFRVQSEGRDRAPTTRIAGIGRAQNPSNKNSICGLSRPFTRSFSLS